MIIIVNGKKIALHAGRKENRDPFIFISCLTENKFSVLYGQRLLGCFRDSLRVAHFAVFFNVVFNVDLPFIFQMNETRYSGSKSYCVLETLGMCMCFNNSRLRFYPRLIASEPSGMGRDLRQH